MVDRGLSLRTRRLHYARDCPRLPTTAHDCPSLSCVSCHYDATPISTTMVVDIARERERVVVGTPGARPKAAAPLLCSARLNTTQLLCAAALRRSYPGFTSVLGSWGVRRACLLVSQDRSTRPSLPSHEPPPRCKSFILFQFPPRLPPPRSIWVWWQSSSVLSQRTVRCGCKCMNFWLDDVSACCTEGRLVWTGMGECSAVQYTLRLHTRAARQVQAAGWLAARHTRHAPCPGTPGANMQFAVCSREERVQQASRQGGGGHPRRTRRMHRLPWHHHHRALFHFVSQGQSVRSRERERER